MVSTHLDPIVLRNDLPRTEFIALLVKKTGQLVKKYMPKETAELTAESEIWRDLPNDVELFFREKTFCFISHHTNVKKRTMTLEIDVQYLGPKHSKRHFHLKINGQY